MNNNTKSRKCKAGSCVLNVHILRSVIMLFAISTLTACVGIQSFPHTVRAGDTITLAIGSLDGVTRDNITLNYFPNSAPASPMDISDHIRSVIKIFPDKTSRSYWESQSVLGIETIEFMEISSGHGAWQTVLIIDLPSTLPPGTGYMQVSLGAGVVYPLMQAKVDDIKISMEILESNGLALQGDSHDFEYRKLAFNMDTAIGDLTRLEPLKQVIVRNIAGTTSSYPPIAAAEFDLLVPIVDQSLSDVSDQVSNNDIAVILDDQANFVRGQVNLIWARTGNNLKIFITSPTGSLFPNQIRFSVVISNPALQSSNGWVLGNGASLASLTYYDINGNLTSGPTPDITVQ